MWYPCDFSDCTSTGSDDYRNNMLDHFNDDDINTSTAHHMHGYWNLRNNQERLNNPAYLQNHSSFNYPHPFLVNNRAPLEQCNMLHCADPIDDLIPLTREDLLKLQNNDVSEEYSPGGSKDDYSTAGSREEYSPGGSEDIIQDERMKDLFGNDYLNRKKKYSTAELKPDSSLPPVIRRRNRNRRKLLAASLVEGSSTASQWDSDSTKIVQRMRSQSISDDQWAQMMAAQTASQQFPQGHTPQDIAAIAAARRGFNAQGNSTRPSNFGVRGMVSSTSVCDLNSLSQQPQQNQLFNGQGANSFQQLNMMGYNHGMMWAPCDMCQGPPIGYPSSGSNNGMKRTASNLSMNLSSVGSDVSSGYPWGPPPGHLHHHMPFYPGCYPPPNCHSHMGHGVPMQGSAVSIPDSMQTFNKVSTSPAPSVRSSSHRSHKSSKSRSFNNSDKSRSSRIKSRHQSEESEDSRTSSYSEEEADAKITKNSFPNSNLAWQCDHCTFINPGNVRACGMCSKTAGTKQGKKSTDKKRNDHRRRDREKCRKTDHEDDDRNISDYDNENSIIKSNMSFSLKDFKKEAKSKISSANRTSNRYRKKSRRRESSFDSASPSISDIEDEERQLERQLKELRLSARSRQSGDYEGSHNRFRNNDRSSRKREGKHK